MVFRSTGESRRRSVRRKNDSDTITELACNGPHESPVRPLPRRRLFHNSNPRLVRFVDDLKSNRTLQLLSICGFLSIIQGIGIVRERLAYTLTQVGDRIVHERVREKEARLLKELNVDIVINDPITPRSNDITTRAALKDILIRREKRSQRLAMLEEQAPSRTTTCNSDSADDCGIPRIVFVPDVLNWHSVRPGFSRMYQKLVFDDSEIRRFLQDTRPSILKFFDTLSKPDQIELWAVCAIHYLGGVFVTDWGRLDWEITNDLLWSSTSSPVLNSGEMRSQLAFAVLDVDSEMQILAATPRHPILLCLLEKLEEDTSMKFRSNIKATLPGTKYGIWTRFGLSTDTFNCKELDQMQVGENLSSADLDVANSSADALLFAIESESPEIKETVPPLVSIEQDPSVVPSTPSPKVSLFERLKGKGLLPQQLCMGCLRTPYFGRIDECSLFCRPGYSDVVCREPDVPERKIIPMYVTISGRDPSFRSGTAIPKVISQTWFEEVTLDRYPQLARLQKSWIASGYEYRLYSDEQARAFIRESYPSRFLDAFDTLIPGAYKADLFRYLVLLKFGGIYADIDLILDTNLDQFLTPSMSFFAPRDTVAEFAGEPFCLWNGFMGASPGHPFLISAVERLVSMILNRADVFDIERELCRNESESLEIWKVRLEIVLALSGTCGLGIAVNDAIGRASMTGFDTGWLELDASNLAVGNDYGDALILMSDKHDVGTLRLSDPEHGMKIIASTVADSEGIKDDREMAHPMLADKQRLLRRETRKVPHYSKTQQRVEVWGSTRVYKDLNMAHETIKFQSRSA